MTRHVSRFVPIPHGERIALLDVLRGFALLGILLANVEAFSGPIGRALSGLDPTLTGLDRWFDGAVYLLVQGKFYTLFALLFGAGFAVFLQRAEARGGPAGGLYLRRCLSLLAIGLLHFLFLWSGDILTVYALVGIVLLIGFRTSPTANLPGWGLFFFCIPIVLTLLFAMSAESARQTPQGAAELARQLQQQAADVADLDAAQRAAYGPQGSFAEANAQRRRELGDAMRYLPYSLAPLVLGLFIFGAWLLRSGVWQRPQAHGWLFRRMRLIGFGVGLPLAGLSFWLQPTLDYGRLDFVSAAAHVSMQVASLLLALAYASSIALALQHPVWRQRWLLLAPAGQMALTHYLAQSIICVGVFYGYGLGYFERLPRLWQVPFALALYVAQVAFSHWWLQRFRFGPAEWLWRSLTYLSSQPMRRPEAD